MKRFIPFVLGIALLAVPAVSQAATSEFAQAGRFGLGLGGGSLSSGLSGKLYLSDAMALQAVVGTWGWSSLSVGVDGVWEMPSLFSNDVLNINWNLGVGAGGVVGGGFNGLSISALAGLGFQLKNIPIEFVPEFRPTFIVGNEFVRGLYWGGGGHIRYFF